MIAPALRASRRAEWDRVAAWALANLPALLRDYTGRELSRSGRCACPLHGGDNPEALSVRAGKGWRCWTGDCGGGDGVDFVRVLRFGALPRSDGRMAALRELAPRAGVFLADAGTYRAPPISAPPVQAPRPAAPPPDPYAELRAAGMVPSLPPVLYGATLAALELTPRGAAYLQGRGLDPDAACAYGFRSVDDGAGWRALRAALGDDFHPVELRAAGLTTGALPPHDWPADAPALLLPYWHRGELAGLRLRRLDGGDAHVYHTFGGANPPAPFNADALDDAAGAVVYVVEGEVNAYTLATYGRHAIGLPGATTWGTYAAGAFPRLRAARRVVGWWDDDKTGREGLAIFARLAHAQLGARWLGAHVVGVTVDTDANDLHTRGALADTLAALETIPPAPRA